MPPHTGISACRPAAGADFHTAFLPFVEVMSTIDAPPAQLGPNSLDTHCPGLLKCPVVPNIGPTMTGNKAVAKRFFIIDGLSQIFRCYYAPFRALSAPSGEPTRATYVFTNMLLQLIREQKPDYLALAMDSDEGEVFRLGIDEEYKANREPAPEDLAPQIERILQIVESQGIPILSVPGFEADDVMATMCKKLAEKDVHVLLVGTDKDLHQLLSEKVCMFDPGKAEVLGPEELREKKGYGPEQAVEIQTLAGDTTDNIPGVKGVGPKKAAALIEKYGSAAEVIKHADELTPAMSRNVKDFADRMEATRELVTLRKDVPIDFDLKACRFTDVNKAALQPIVAELGFRRLVEQMSDAEQADTAGASGTQTELFAASAGPRTRAAGPPARRDYVLVDDQKKFGDFLKALKTQSIFAFDTETTSLNPVWADLCGMSFSWQASKGYYLPFMGVGECLPADPALAALRPVMADAGIEKVGQNIKYDLVVLAHYDMPVAGVCFDTMIASFVLDSARKSHGLDALARDLLGIETIPISDLIGKGKNQVGFDTVDTARACEYATEDADVTWQLYELFNQQLAGSELEKLFRETEMPLVEVLAAIESEGVKIDTEILARMSAELAEQLDKLTGQIYEHAGHPFNIDSPKQLSAVLFDELNLPVIRKTKTGRSTDADTLETLSWQTEHPVPALISQYREITKLKGTYVDTLPQMICPRTGRIHASFHQASAITGRLSSSDPNLQNIPVRTELGRQIRKAFVPRDADRVLLTADYSQIELRMLAHFSQDPALIKAFADDQDIHCFVASQVFDVPVDEVTHEQRGRAKAVNFGIIYGQTPHGLSRTTGMPVGEAKTFIERYFKRYPKIRWFFDTIVADAKRNGFVKTILGRRRAVPDIDSRNANIRASAERLTINTTLQGSAADLIKRAMINIHRIIVAENRPARMLIQVHDELVFDIPRDAVEAEADFIRNQMCNALPLDVPVKVDLAWGDNWLEAK